MRWWVPISMLVWVACGGAEGWLKGERSAERARCGAGAEAVVAELGLAGLGLGFEPAAVEAQGRLAGDVCLEWALAAALRGFLEDVGAREGPRALVEALPVEGPCADPEVERRVRCWMRRADSRLGLVAADESTAEELEEIIDDGWVFYLSMPGLSDHVFWAVVDRWTRDGRPVVVVHGAN